MGQKLTKAPRGDYDAIVYIEGSEVVAEDSNGRKIASGVAGTDDATVIQAAVNTLSSKSRLMFNSGQFDIKTTVNFPLPFDISGMGDSTTIIPNADPVFDINPQTIPPRVDCYGDRIHDLSFDGTLSSITGYTLIRRNRAHYNNTYNINTYGINGRCLQYIGCWSNSLIGNFLSVGGVNHLQAILLSDGLGTNCTGTEIVNTNFAATLQTDITKYVIESDAHSSRLNVVNCDYESSGVGFFKATDPRWESRFTNMFISVISATDAIAFNSSFINCDNIHFYYGTANGFNLPTGSYQRVFLRGITSTGIRDTLIRMDGFSGYLNVRDFNIESCYRVLGWFSGALGASIVIKDGTITTVTGHGINYDFANWFVVKNVRFAIPSPVSDNAYYLIKSRSSIHVPIIEYCYFGSPLLHNPRYCIDTNGAVRAVMNEFHDDIIDSRRMNSTSGVIRYNTGYPTDASGSSTGTGSEQTIAHGLLAIPIGCKAWITYKDAGGDYITEFVRFNDTHIKVNLDTGIAYTWGIGAI